MLPKTTARTQTQGDSPTAIAVDEPTASLDRNAAATFVQALHVTAAHGTAILVASHDPAVIDTAHTVTHLS
ncbi:MAG TPA: hypothetical protein VGK17_11260 [Propionicimonas sp.]